jgi:hypothetical protein
VPMELLQLQLNTLQEMPRADSMQVFRDSYHATETRANQNVIVIVTFEFGFVEVHFGVSL